MRHRISVFCIALATSLLYCFAGQAGAHPCDGYPCGDPWPGYGTPSGCLPAEMSLGDLGFTGAYPPVSALTPHEMYYLFGTKDGPEGAPLAPYCSEVMGLVYRYYNLTGRVPGEFGMEQIAAALGLDTGQVDAVFAETLRSPITGEYPRLDCAVFTPGQFYVRVLTEDEIRHFATIMPKLKSVYFGREVWDPGQDTRRSAKLLGPVMYYRVYGERDVLYEQIFYIYE